MFALILVCAFRQEPVDQKKIDHAVEEGAKYLLKECKSEGSGNRSGRNGRNGSEDWSKKDELILLTLIHAGIDESDADFAKLLKNVLEARLENTYRVALQAMALEALDATKYQGRIAQCGQFLIDNQCTNGQWTYGKEVPLDAWTPSSKSTSAGTKSRPRIVIVKRRNGPGTGDNSNTQYALLGLRACMQADVIIPAETFAKAAQWWLTTQNKDGGWDYRGGRTRIDHSYGAMTAGAASSLAICDFFLKRDFKKDPAIARALDWVAGNFSVTSHPKYSWDSPRHGWFHYWLYALERAGMLCEKDKLGAHDWYQEGARHLIDTQSKDGSWEGERDTVINTCFAILFLRKATKPLKGVATEDVRKP